MVLVTRGALELLWGDTDLVPGKDEGTWHLVDRSLPPDGAQRSLRPPQSSVLR